MKLSKLWLFFISSLLAAFVIPIFADIPDVDFTIDYTVKEGAGEYNGTHTFTFHKDGTFTSDVFSGGSWETEYDEEKESEKITWRWANRSRGFLGTFCPGGEGDIKSYSLHDGGDRLQHSKGTCSEIIESP